MNMELFDISSEMPVCLKIENIRLNDLKHEVINGAEDLKNAEGMTIEMIGNPQKDALHWHLQEHPMSCAVACQEFVAEALLGIELSETNMREYARANNWFSDNGTLSEDTDNILEALGIETELTYENTLESIKNVIKNGGKVIAGVNNMVLERPILAMLPGFGPNHMVEVIGIDESNPEDVRIILNDPGVENGAGRSVPLKTFEKAWSTSDDFMISAYKPEGAKHI